MSAMESAISKLRAQQGKVKARSAQWMVAEQLIELCQREPQVAELLDKDLDVAEMSITAAEKKIKEFADGHKTGNFSCVTPAEADGILRKFYGLPRAGSAPVKVEQPQPEETKVLDLMDFLR